MAYKEIKGFEHRWSYVPSAPTWELRRDRLRALRSRIAFPTHQLVRKPVPAPVWVLYFLYTPGGQLTHGQRYSLQRIKDMGLMLHVVCASKSLDDVPAELNRYADAVHWKALAGYDISGYTLGLLDIAEHAPGATVFVLNDSFWGPLTDLRPFIASAPWDLTGLTGQDNDENHIQSYAWILKDVTPQRMQSLARVFTTKVAYNWSNFVIAAQEVPLAREASKSMTVGAYLFSQIKRLGGDPCLVRAFDLIDAGHPFLKKSLLGKMAYCQDVERVATFVVDHGLAGPREAIGTTRA